MVPRDGIEPPTLRFSVAARRILLNTPDKVIVA
jgi:hypothetical protein